MRAVFGSRADRTKSAQAAFATEPYRFCLAGKPETTILVLDLPDTHFRFEVNASASNNFLVVGWIGPAFIQFTFYPNTGCFSDDFYNAVKISVNGALTNAYVVGYTPQTPASIPINFYEPLNLEVSGYSQLM